MFTRAKRCLRLVVAASSLIGASAGAGPLVLEESARLVSPDNGFTLNGQVAVDGDLIIAIGSRADLQGGYLQRRGLPRSRTPMPEATARSATSCRQL